MARLRTSEDHDRDIRPGENELPLDRAGQSVADLKEN
jgi:hypothetical protein